jgi:hypothetical protein
MRRLKRALYQQTVTSETRKIQEFGHHDAIGDEYLRPLFCFQGKPLGTAVLSDALARTLLKSVRINIPIHKPF